MDSVLCCTCESIFNSAYVKKSVKHVDLEVSAKNGCEECRLLFNVISHRECFKQTETNLSNNVHIEGGLQDNSALLIIFRGNYKIFHFYHVEGDLLHDLKRCVYCAKYICR
jgi:hypothetical protein